MEEVLDTLPSGTDVVKKGNFDRIILDTAPTGRTLRRLSAPGFLMELIDRLLLIATDVNSNTALKMLISGFARGVN
jgi:anion-transporting  ArsA/GET3 family ATPase